MYLVLYYFINIYIFIICCLLCVIYYNIQVLLFTYYAFIYQLFILYVLFILHLLFIQYLIILDLLFIKNCNLFIFSFAYLLFIITYTLFI